MQADATQATGKAERQAALAMIDRHAPRHHEATHSWRRQRPGKRLSYRKISAELAEAGHKNERGEPYNPKSIKAMVDS